MKYKTQIRKRLMYHLHINGWHKYPRPSWYYPTDGWITDEQEIVNAMRLDDDLGIAPRDITEGTSLAGQNGTLSTQSKDSEEK